MVGISGLNSAGSRVASAQWRIGAKKWLAAYVAVALKSSDTRVVGARLTRTVHPAHNGTNVGKHVQALSRQLCNATNHIAGDSHIPDRRRHVVTAASIADLHGVLNGAKFVLRGNQKSS